MDLLFLNFSLKKATYQDLTCEKFKKYNLTVHPGVFDGFTPLLKDW